MDDYIFFNYKEREKIRKTQDKKGVRIFGNLVYDDCIYVKYITPLTINRLLNYEADCYAEANEPFYKPFKRNEEEYTVKPLGNGLFIAFNEKQNNDEYTKNLFKNRKRTFNNLIINSKYIVFRCDKYGTPIDLTKEDILYLESIKN